MQLFDNPASPYCRKVKALIHEADLGGQVEIVSVSGGPTAPNTLPVAQNPLGKIPCLTRETGPALYDSRVICRYLASLSEFRAYPEARLWDVLTLEATADGIMDAALLIVYEDRVRPEDMRIREWTDAQWVKIDRAAETLNARWMGHLEGAVDMSHLAIACALGYVDFRLGDRDWRAGRSALTGWYARMQDNESIRITQPSD